WGTGGNGGPPEGGGRAEGSCSPIGSQSRGLNQGEYDEWSLYLDDEVLGPPPSEHLDEDSPSEGGASGEDAVDVALLQDVPAEDVNLDNFARTASKWTPLVEELLAREGMLSEVLVNAERYEEIPLIQSIALAAPGRASLAVLG